MTLPETSDILCIFPTSNPKTLSLTEMRKKGPRPLPSHLPAGEHSAVSVPLGVALWASDQPRKNPGVSTLIRAAV